MELATTRRKWRRQGHVLSKLPLLYMLSLLILTATAVSGASFCGCTASGSFCFGGSSTVAVAIDMFWKQKPDHAATHPERAG